MAGMKNLNTKSVIREIRRIHYSEESLRWWEIRTSTAQFKGFSQFVILPQHFYPALYENKNSKCRRFEDPYRT